MPEAKRKHSETAQSDLALEGFESIFEDLVEKVDPDIPGATTSGDVPINEQIEKLVGRFSELITLTVDQRVETARIAGQLIENQRQLIATQQILIRLMEKSIELTRHVTGIEEKLPAVFELPELVESLRLRVAQLEGIEVK